MTQRVNGSTWPIVGRDVEFRRSLAALNNGEFHGVALVGDGGVGKSTLARMLAKTVESAGRTVRFALGTQTGWAVPLGAFSRAVSLGVGHEPAIMLAAAHNTLGQDKNLVVVVDEAQLLDPLSATLVNQLAAGRSARLIVTIRSGEPVLDAVTALLKERLLLTVHVDPFTREQTELLAGAVLGGPVDTRLVDELFERSAGNLLLLRGFLTAGVESGALVHTEQGWQLQGPLRGDRELHDALEYRLQSLSSEEREVVEVLATAELLEWEILRDICDADAMASLERRGLIQLVTDGSHTLVQLNHPMLGEAATRHAGVVRSRQLNGILAKTLRKHLRAAGRRSQISDPRGRIQLAQFIMRSDLEPDLDVVIKAAADAMAMSNVVLGEQLATFAVDRGGGLPAALVLAEAVSWQGRGEEADSILLGADVDDADEWLIARWGCLRAANLAWGCGDAEGATRVLAEVKQRLATEGSLQLIDALDVLIGFFRGDIARTIEFGPRLCEPDVVPMATVWAAVATCGALTAVGRFSEVGRIAAAERSGSPSDWPRSWPRPLPATIRRPSESTSVTPHWQPAFPQRRPWSTRCSASCSSPAVSCRTPAPPSTGRFPSFPKAFHYRGSSSWAPCRHRPKGPAGTARRPPWRCGGSRKCSCRNSSSPGPGSGRRPAIRRALRRRQCRRRRLRGKPACTWSRCGPAMRPFASAIVRRPRE